jgi:hypothetical protein
MLKNKGPNYIARGLRVSRHAPWVSHLHLADDCLVFSEATDESALRIVSILDDYNTLLHNMFIVSTGKVSLVSAHQADTIYTI